MNTSKSDPLTGKAIRNRPTIVHVVTHYPPHIGGMENVAYEISRGFAKNNWPVQVVTSVVRGFDLPKKEERDNYQLYRLNNNFEFARNPIMFGLVNQLISIPKKSIIHLHMSHVVTPEVVSLISKLRHIPYVAHFHIDVNLKGVLGLLLSIYEKVSLGPVLRNASRVIVCSPKQAELVKRKFFVDHDKIVLISNGVANHFFKLEPRALPQDTLKLLFVGRLAVRKRVDLLLEAIAITKVPVKLIVVGDGEMRFGLEKLAKTLGLNNITFAGAKTGNELAKYYQAADAFVLPSEREGGCPLVALEAMASGLPVIGSDVLGVRELIAKCGILVEPSKEAFAQAFESLWQNQDQFTRLSRQSFTKAKKYSWNNLIKKLEPVYEAVFREYHQAFGEAAFDE